jgi:hypothetical protein
MSWKDKLPSAQPKAEEYVTINARVSAHTAKQLQSCAERMAYRGRNKRAQLAGDILEDEIAAILETVNEAVQDAACRPDGS